MPDSQAQRKARERERKAQAGLKRLELWAKPKHHEPIRKYAETLKEKDDGEETK